MPVVPVLSKFLLGFLIPRFHRDVPDDFPYNPYWRDFLITSLSMMCRGEFNFVVASLALRLQLISPTAYAGIVFAVLLSCILAPLILARIIQYYNKKSLEYLDRSHPIQRIGDTCDGYRPLFLAIQARTPVHWGMHDRIEQTLESAGLIIIDHRSWHTLGYKDAVNITEIFCQDKEIQVKIRGCFSDDNQCKRSVRLSERIEYSDCENKKSTLRTFEETEESDEATVSSETDAIVSRRKEEIQQCKQSIRHEHHLSSLSLSHIQRFSEIHTVVSNIFGTELDPNEYAIQVSEWETFSFQKDLEQQNSGTDKERGYCFHSHTNLPDEIEDDEKEGETNNEDRFVTPNRKILNRAKSNASAAESVHEDPHLETKDLWETDDFCHYVAREGYYQTPFATDGSTTVTVEEGCHQVTPNHRRTDSSSSQIQNRQQDQPSTNQNISRRGQHNRSHTFDARLLDSYNIETYTIKERLHGYVR